MLLVNDEYSANKSRKWSTQSREASSWYEHEELGYNYRISNVIAGVIRGQWKYLTQHIEQKKTIYERYKCGLKNLPVTMNPVQNGRPNYWLSSMLIDHEAMAETTRSGRKAVYNIVNGKSSPSEVLEALNSFNAEGRPIWKPMHLQPIYISNGFVTRFGNGRAGSNAYIRGSGELDVSSDLFERGVCLPSDNKMTEDEQKVIINVISQCFK